MVCSIMKPIWIFTNIPLIPGARRDQIFGITRLLGFEFAPRIRDLGENLIFPIDKPQAYPYLAPLLGGMINIKHIESNWDGLLLCWLPVISVRKMRL
jgi:TnpA family transposase